MRDKIEKIIKENIQIQKDILNSNIPQIIKATGLIIECLKKNGKVVIFGNGGSAADSQHIAAELIGRFKKERKALPAIALTTNTSVLTALANDYTYDIIFQKQIEGLGRKNDVAIGISTSGKAKNVINGIISAKKLGMKTISLTGKKGTYLSSLTDVAIVVPSENTARIQEAHIMIGHIICELIEEVFANK